jgi:hypothetical protein
MQAAVPTGTERKIHMTGEFHNSELRAEWRIKLAKWSDRNWAWIVPVGAVIALAALFIFASFFGNLIAPGDLN